LTLTALLHERNLAGRDAAFATELAHGTARLQGSYDAIIDAAVDRGVASLRPEVLVGIRLGAHQLLSMRVPSHAAVGTTVELVRDAAGEPPVRLVNAVLRRISTRTLDEWIGSLAPAEADDLVGFLAVVYAHPRWIVEAFLDVLGDPARVAEVLAADNVAPTVTLAVRPGLATVGSLVDGGATAGRWSPYAAILPSGSPSEVPGIRQGVVGVQDEGSQLAAIAFAAAPIEGTDQLWLDLCAGPGGKTALLTGLGRDRGASIAHASSQATSRRTDSHRASSPRMQRDHPGGTAPSTGSCSTHPAPDSAR
jgi:16S rRNA (cytosine967-C5)-methyltransferase